MKSAAISPYIIAIVVAWLVAHIFKYIISIINKEKHELKSHLFRSGGMPSSHSAAVMALATLIGLIDGFDTGLFGVSALFALIVMYDAVKVRRSSGEQGEAIHSLIKAHKVDIRLPRAAKGHTPVEVAAGAVLGVVIGIVVFLATI